jgi:hypothetical protein
MPPPCWRDNATGIIHNWNPPVYGFAEMNAENNDTEVDNNTTGKNNPKTSSSKIKMKPFTPQRSSYSPRKSSHASSMQNIKAYDPIVLSNIGFPNGIRKAANGYSFDENKKDKICRLQSSGIDEYASFFKSSDGATENVNKNTSNTYSYTGSYDHGLLHEETEDQLNERDMIQKFMIDRRAEIIAVLEGVDTATGGVVQARHSYISSDVQWNKSFVPCVFEDQDGAAIIDFSLFHDLKEASYDAAFVGSIPSAL